MNIPDFNKEEFNFLSNAELLISKRVIQNKIYTLLELTKESIEDIVNPSIKQLFPAAKISRGENYNNLPYLILDYPASFSLTNIMACRTMFLWGNFFSTTIHLQGKQLVNNRNQLQAIVARLESKDLFISHGDTPWQYHYSKDNYITLESSTLQDSLNKDFIKISRRIPLSEFKSLPDQGQRFYKPFLDSLKLTP